MRHSTRSAIPIHRNPTLRPGLAALVEFLVDHHYSARAILAIEGFTAVNGTPTGCEHLEPDDEAGATDAFTDALEPVLGDSPAWDDPGVFLDLDSLLEPRGTCPIGPPDGFDEALATFEARHPVRDPLPSSFRSPDDWRQLGGDFPEIPTPIRGGSPESHRHSAEPLEAVSVALYGANPFA